MAIEQMGVPATLLATTSQRVPTPPAILVVDDEPNSRGLIQYLLDAAGYRVRAVDGARAAAEDIDRAIPDLVIVDYEMPEIDGVELVRAIRSDPRLAAVSIVMVTARALTQDKLAGLAAGADDYITKPYEPTELLARVQTVLRRARELRAQSPLTGLPGNVRIEEEIERRISAGDDFALLYGDLDHFKAYNDQYGFGAGDRALRTTAWLIQQVATDVGGPETFIGHVGGDDFVVIADAASGPDIAQAIVARFDAEAPGLYSGDDAARGFIEVLDRAGQLTRFPLMTISIGLSTSRSGPYLSAGEAMGCASRLKSAAKHVPGSSVYAERGYRQPAPA